MAFQPHGYLQLSGSIAGVDQWTFGLRIGTIGDAEDGAWFQSKVDALATTIATWFSAGAQQIASAVDLRSLKFNPITPEGHYRDDTTYAHYWDAGAVKGGSTNPPYPPQCALVATLETGHARGLAHRGRIYLPPITRPIDSASMVLSTAEMNAAATSVVNLINQVNTAMGPPVGGQAFYPVVGIYSRKDPGTARAVTSVRVGAVYDTQQRRRRSLKEGYVSKALAT